MKSSAIDLYCDVVDEDDRVVGTVRRADCHGNPQLIHRAVHVHLFDSAGRLLLQKRSSTKTVQPGKWDTSVGGHLEPGENYLDAARREMHEELGLSRVPLTFLYSYRWRTDFESENVSTYLACSDAGIEYAADEIEAVRFWTRDEIAAALGAGGLTPNFEEEWRRLEAFNRSYSSSSGKQGLCAGAAFPDLLKELAASD